MKEWGEESVFCEGTSHSAGQMILFRKGFSGNFNLVGETERILIVLLKLWIKEL